MIILQAQCNKKNTFVMYECNYMRQGWKVGTLLRVLIIKTAVGINLKGGGV